MTIQSVIFVVLVFTTFFNNGVQLYIHQEAYPLLAFVGKSEFSAYLNEYERQLTLPLLVPYGLTVLSNLILVFTHLASIGVIWLIVTLVLNIAVAAVTMMLATPIYNRIKQAGQVSREGLSELLNVNLIRLGLSSLSSLVIILLLLGALSA